MANPAKSKAIEKAKIMNQAFSVGMTRYTPKNSTQKEVENGLSKYFKQRKKR